MRALILFALAALQSLAYHNNDLDLVNPLTGNCTLCGFYDQHRLQVNCVKDNSTNVTSELHLKNCIGNKNGTLVMENQGNYTDSCERCRMSNGFILDCRCEEDLNWVVDYSHLNLGLYLTVDNGYIGCMNSNVLSASHVCGQA